MTPKTKALIIAFTVAGITAIGETAEKLAPTYADTEYAFLFKVLGAAFAAFRLYLIQPPEKKGQE